MPHGKSAPLGCYMCLWGYLWGVSRAVIKNISPPLRTSSLDVSVPRVTSWIVVQCDAFRAILRDEFNMPCTIRQEKGSDIAGACGQLAIDHKSPHVKGILDIEEVAARLLAV